MGCFDSIISRCPKCGKRIEFQSKAGDCMLRIYDPEDAPVEIVKDLMGSVEICDCGASCTLIREARAVLHASWNIQG
jgi:hypothetical protein